MRKIRELLRLEYKARLSNQVIAGARKVSNCTLEECLQRAKAAEVS